MSQDNSGYLKGHFLMAIPGLPDPNFAQSVICMCEHNESGALGFIINKIHPLLTARELFDDLNIQYPNHINHMDIHLGGPVQPSGVFILHGPPFNWQGCMKITDNLGLSNTRDIIEAIAMEEGPESFLVMLGCAGWGPFQLEQEINDNAWLSCPISEKILFKTEADMRWEQAMMLMGDESGRTTGISGQA